MKRWLISVLLVGCAPSEAPAPEAPPEPSALEVAHEAALAGAIRAQRELDCGDDTRWPDACHLADLPGGAVEVPPVPTPFPGVQFALRPSRTLPDGTAETLRMAHLVISEEGARVTPLRPTSGAEAQEAVTMVRLVRGALGAQIEAIEVSEGMYQFLHAPVDDVRPLQRDAHGVGWEGTFPTRLYRTPGTGERPPAWVTVEDTGAGLLVSVFPEVSTYAPAPIP